MRMKAGTSVSEMGPRLPSAPGTQVRQPVAVRSTRRRRPKTSTSRISAFSRRMVEIATTERRARSGPAVREVLKQCPCRHTDASADDHAVHRSRGMRARARALAGSDDKRPEVSADQPANDSADKERGP